MWERHVRFWSPPRSSLVLGTAGDFASPQPAGGQPKTSSLPFLPGTCFPSRSKRSEVSPWPQELLASNVLLSAAPLYCARGYPCHITATSLSPAGCRETFGQVLSPEGAVQAAGSCSPLSGACRMGYKTQGMGMGLRHTTVSPELLA